MTTILGIRPAFVTACANRGFAMVYIGAIALSSVLLFAVAVPLCLVTWPFDRRRRVLHGFTSFWGCLFLWYMPMWRIRVLGCERLRGGPHVIVSNHQSLLDIPLAHRLFIHFKWVSKASMFRFPIIGWTMWLNGYIGLRRGDLRSMRAMMDECRRTLAAGSSVFLFPEGTRSPDGTVQDFKSGAFKLARELGLPILPVAISGTAAALPKGSFRYHGNTRLTIEVLAPIEPADYAGLDAAATAALARERIVEAAAEH